MSRTNSRRIRHGKWGKGKLTALLSAVLFAAAFGTVLGYHLLFLRTGTEASLNGGVPSVLVPSEAERYVLSCTEEEAESVDPSVNVITLSFVGDCTIASPYGHAYFNTFNLMAEEKTPDYFFSQVAPLFLEDDLTVANCENVFSDDETLALRGKNYTPAYWYRGPAKNAAILSLGGVDAVSIDNNHIMDYLAKGRLDTIAALEEAGIDWGDSSRILYYDFYGIRIALCFCSMNVYGYSASAELLLEEAKTQSDFQIIIFHGGSDRSYVTDEGILTECRRLVDLGADLICGHHPHVLQPVQLYKGVVIMPSLGNFLFGDGWSVKRTAVLQYRIYVKAGEIISESCSFLPCYTNQVRWQPSLIDPVDESEDYYAVLDFLYGQRETPQ